MTVRAVDLKRGVLQGAGEEFFGEGAAGFADVEGGSRGPVRSGAVAKE